MQDWQSLVSYKFVHYIFFSDSPGLALSPNTSSLSKAVAVNCARDTCVVAAQVVWKYNTNFAFHSPNCSSKISKACARIISKIFSFLLAWV